MNSQSVIFAVVNGQKWKIRTVKILTADASTVHMIVATPCVYVCVCVCVHVCVRERIDFGVC